MNELERNKQLAKAYLDAITRGDVEHIKQSLASDAVMCTTGSTLGSGTYSAQDAVKFAAGAFAAFPTGLKMTVHAMTAEGDRVAVEAESHATHVSGTPYNNVYHFLFRIQDGKIKEFKEYSDTELVTKVVFGGKSKLNP